MSEENTSCTGIADKGPSFARNLQSGQAEKTAELHGIQNLENPLAAIDQGDRTSLAAGTVTQDQQQPQAGTIKVGQLTAIDTDFGQGRNVVEKAVKQIEKLLPPGKIEAA